MSKDISKEKIINTEKAPKKAHVKKPGKPKKPMNGKEVMQRIQNKSQKLIASGKSMNDVINAIALDVAYSKGAKRTDELTFNTKGKSNKAHGTKDKGKLKNSNSQSTLNPKILANRIKSDIQRKLEIIKNASILES